MPTPFTHPDIFSLLTILTNNSGEEPKSNQMPLHDQGVTINTASLLMSSMHNLACPFTLSHSWALFHFVTLYHLAHVKQWLQYIIKVWTC